MLSLRTLQPKELLISIPFRQTLFYSDMGGVTYGHGDPAVTNAYLCPNVFAINMSDPLRDIIGFSQTLNGVAGTPQASVSNQKLLATRELSMTNDLSEELEHYFAGHKNMVAVGSTCWINATQVANHAWPPCQLGAPTPT